MKIYLESHHYPVSAVNITMKKFEKTVVFEIELLKQLE
jgi:hypothetical protein